MDKTGRRSGEMRKPGRLLTAMVTPFKESGEVNYEQAKKLALALLDSGSDGLVVAATTGEAPTLTWDEEMRLFTELKSTVGDRGTIVAYTGSNSTAEAVEATEKAEKIGVDACLSVVPYYNKPNQEGIYQHFKTIAESTSLPVIMYNIPSRVVINMSWETIARLSQIKNIIGVKEANGDMAHVAQTLSNAKEGFLIWSGNDNDTFLIMALGGYGVIGVTTHLVGKQYQQMMNLILGNRIAEAATIQRHLVPLVNAMFSVPSPAPIKHALNYLGFNVGKPRLPLVEVDKASAAKIEETLKKYQIDLPVK
jgi:4-hydroxy-tetrahydrodipicolinate synthase